MATNTLSVAKGRLRDAFSQPQRFVERAIVAIADAQRGLITLAQLFELGLTQDAVSGRVRDGRLTRVHQGVFAVGRVTLDARARWKAATLACGAGAVVSHLSAGGLWGVWAENAGRPHVTMAGNGRLGHTGIVMHRMRQMHPDDAAEVDGIPVTSLELTCLHLGTMLGQRSLERSIVKAARNPLFSVDRALALCDRSSRRPGVKPFRRVIARDLTAEMHSLSELELRFVEVLRHKGIRMPEVNHNVEALMVDAVWHDSRVVVELDGFEFHKLPRDLRRDNARTTKLVLAGYRVIRFTWDDVVGDPASVANAISTLLDT